LERYLEEWIDRDLNEEDPDPESMAYEQDYSRENSTENGQDGQEINQVRDYRVSNDFRKASTLRTSTETTTKNVMINGIEKGMTRNNTGESMETTDRNATTNGTTNGMTRNETGITQNTTNGTMKAIAREASENSDEEMEPGQLNFVNTE